MRRSPRPTDLPHVFRGHDAVACGLLTPTDLRGPLVRRVLHGVYRPAWVPLTHELKCEAAGLVLPPSGRITGRSMATVLGVPLARAHDDVEVAVDEREYTGGRRGLLIRRVMGGTGPGRGWRTAQLGSAFRLGFDLAARHDLPTATAHLDAVIGAGLLEIEDLAAALDACHANDVRQVRRALELADARSGSVPESKVRVILTLAGFDVVPQYVVISGSAFVAQVDLALPALKIAIEYDGGWHVLREQLEKDRRRLNALREAGWSVVHVTAAMLADPRALVDGVGRAVTDRAR